MCPHPQIDHDSLLAVKARQLGYDVPPDTSLAKLAQIVGCFWEQAASMQDQKQCRGQNYIRLRTRLSEVQGHQASQSERPKKEPGILQQARKLGHILPFPCSLFCLAQNIGVRWEAVPHDSGTKSQMSISGKNRRRVIQAIQDEITAKEREEEIAEVILETFPSTSKEEYQRPLFKRPL